MKNLLMVDAYKSYKSKLIPILFILAIASATLMLYFSHQIAQGKMDGTSNLIHFFSDLQIFSLFGSILIGMFFCEDFQNKIIENAISSGHKRSTIVISKLISLFLLTGIFAVPYCAALFLANSMHWKMTVYMGTPFLSLIELLNTHASIWKVLLMMIIVIFIYTAQLSIGIPILFFIKKPVLVMIIMYSLLGFLGSLLTIDNAVQDLMSATPYGVDFLKMVTHFDSETLFKPIIISFLFICLMLGSAVFFFKKAEIK